MLPALSVATMAISVRQSGQSGEQSAREVAEGASSVANNAYKAGEKIGNVLLRGVLEPFGRSGIALGNFAQTITKTLGDGLSGALKGGTALAGMAGEAVGLGVGAAGAGAGLGMGALVGGLFGGPILGSIIGGAVGSLAGLFVMKMTEAIASLVGNVLEAGGQMLGAFGEVVSQALSTIFEIAKDISDEARKWATSVLAFSNATTLSLTQSAQFATRAGGFGITPDSLTQMFGGAANQPFFYRQRAAAHGLNAYDDPEFMNSFADRYQKLFNSGPFGYARAEGMAMDLGVNNNPQFMFMANLSREKRESQIAYSDKLTGGLGLDADQIRTIAEDWTLMIQRVEQFASMVKIKVMGALAPLASGLLEKATEALANNGDAIGGFIEKSVAWITERLPQMFLDAGEFVLNGARVIISALADAGRFMVNSALTVADWIEAWQKGEGSILDIIGSLAQGFDLTTTLFSSFAGVLGFLGSSVWNVMLVIESGVKGLFGGLISYIQAVIGQMSNVLAKIPGLEGVASFGRDLADFKIPDLKDLGGNYKNPLAEYHEGRKSIPQTNFHGAVENLRNSNTPGDVAKSIRSNANKANDWINGAEDKANAKIDELHGTLKDTHQVILGVAQSVKEGADAGKKTAGNTDKTASQAEKTAFNTQSMLERTVARTMAELATDTVNGLLRA